MLEHERFPHGPLSRLHVLHFQITLQGFQLNLVLIRETFQHQACIIPVPVQTFSEGVLDLLPRVLELAPLDRPANSPQPCLILVENPLTLHLRDGLLQALFHVQARSGDIRRWRNLLRRGRRINLFLLRNDSL